MTTPLRRPLRPLLPLLLLALAAGPAEAARQARLSLSGGVFHRSDDGRTGPFVGITATLFSGERLSFGVAADYVRTTGTVEQAVTAREGGGTVVVRDDQEHHYFPAFAQLAWRLGDVDAAAVPYLIGGIGFTSARSYHDNAEGKRSRAFYGPGFELGAGVNLGSFFVEGSWQGGSIDSANDDPRAGTPPGEEFKPAGFGVRAGFRF